MDERRTPLLSGYDLSRQLKSNQVQLTNRSLIASIAAPTNHRLDLLTDALYQNSYSKECHPRERSSARLWTPYGRCDTRSYFIPCCTWSIYIPILLETIWDIFGLPSVCVQGSPAEQEQWSPRGQSTTPSFFTQPQPLLDLSCSSNTPRSQLRHWGWHVNRAFIQR